MENLLFNHYSDNKYGVPASKECDGRLKHLIHHVTVEGENYLFKSNFLRFFSLLHMAIFYTQELVALVLFLRLFYVYFCTFFFSCMQQQLEAIRAIEQCLLLIWLIC